MSCSNDQELIKGLEHIATCQSEPESGGLSIGVDWKFWALIPAININLHGPTFEIEWLCFYFYLDL